MVEELNYPEQMQLDVRVGIDLSDSGLQVQPSNHSATLPVQSGAHCTRHCTVRATLILSLCCGVIEFSVKLLFTSLPRSQEMLDILSKTDIARNSTYSPNDREVYLIESQGK